MAHELDIAHIASRISKEDLVSIGVDSIRDNEKIIYNLKI